MCRHVFKRRKTYKILKGERRKGMKKFVSTLALAGVTTLALASCGPNAIKIWCSEVEGVSTAFKEAVDTYVKENEITLPVEVVQMSEGEAAGNVLNDVDTAADIYCFAQDNLARLVSNNGIVPVSDSYADDVKRRNDDVSVKCSTVGDVLYAYPLTSDNGYIMMYDKSVMQGVDMTNLEDIIKKCEETSTNFSFELTNAWYLASFFFAQDDQGAALCEDSWTADSDGNFTSYVDTFNTDNGLIALKGLYNTIKSKSYKGEKTGAGDFNAAVKSSVVITGSWGTTTAKQALGDNLGATVLPKFHVDNKAYQLGSFSGCKLIGCKPQVDEERAKICQGLANYLSNEALQTRLFEEQGWGGSNKNLQNTEAFKNDAVLSALNKQAKFAVAQGNILGDWWSLAAKIETDAKKLDKDKATDEALKKVLDDYEKALVKAQGEASKPAPTFQEDDVIWVGDNQGWKNADKNSLLVKDGNVKKITVTFEQAENMGGRIIKPGSWEGTTVATVENVTEGLDLVDVDKSNANNDKNIYFKEAGTYLIVFDGTNVKISKVTA